MYEIKRICESTCPYIQNKPPEKKWVIDSKGNWSEKPESTPKEKKINPEDNGYHDEKGYYIPAKHFWKSMEESSKKIQLGQNKRSRLSEYFIACIRLDPLKIYLGKKRPDGIYNEPINKKSKDGGEEVWNPRPQFNHWKVTITITVLEDSIPEEKIEECLIYAGLYKGIGSRAPEYGRFIVKKS